MILTILIIAVTFGTESEFQGGVVQFRPPAHRASVHGAVRIGHMRTRLFLKLPLSRLLLRCIGPHIPAGQKKQNKIQKEKNYKIKIIIKYQGKENNKLKSEQDEKTQ